MKSKLTIIRGLPGSGKSTFANETFGGRLILENDMFLYNGGAYCFSAEKRKYAIDTIRRITEDALAHGVDVVLCNTFTRKAHIVDFYRMAKKLKCDFEIYRLRGEFNNIHSVPEETLIKMKNDFEDIEGEKNVYIKNYGYCIE